MGKKGSSIRMGFQYQDLVCAVKLLDLIEQGQFTTAFSIESDEVNFVDDLIIFPPRGTITAYQIKAHVVRSHFDSFDTLIAKRTPDSRSQLKKLFDGWQHLCNSTAMPVEIEFISAGQTDTASGGLADAISTIDDRIDASFFSDSRFAAGRDKWLNELGVSAQQLEDFLKRVRWRFSHVAHSALRDDAINRLRRLKLPSHGAAVAELLSTVAKIATSKKGRTSISDFLRMLWNRSAFREACEERFANIDFGIPSAKRATLLRAVIVDLTSIPAYSSTEFACLEEPCPLAHCASGISETHLAGLLDDQRGSLKVEYLAWQRKRVLSLLDRIGAANPHLIIFPRFSIPFDTALDIFAWAESRECSVYIAGHSLEPADGGVDDLKDFLNVRQVADVREASAPVADILLRSHRSGRSEFSDVASPYSASEHLLSDPILVQTRMALPVVA